MSHSEQSGRRLIEDFFPSAEVSEEAYRERYGRTPSPHSVFTWWARRPHAAARAVVAATLLRDSEATSLAEIYDACGRRCGAGQRVLDPFAGGATFPLEAARFGAEVHSLESNELAHFLQRGLLNFSQAHRDLPDQIEAAGEALLEDLRDQTAHFFPGRDAGEEGRTIAYHWSREVACPECDGELSLMRRPWLSKRKGSTLFMRRRPDAAQGCYDVRLVRNGEPDDESSAWEGRSLRCPFCGHRVHREALDALMVAAATDRLLACTTSKGRYKKGRKQFHEATAALVPDPAVLQAAIDEDLAALGETLPAVVLPRWSGVTNPSLYGMGAHVELFNLRQRAVLVRLCRLLREHHDARAATHGDEQAWAVTAFLSGLIDQLVDWNSRLATWISQNEQVGRGLSGPGMAMIWDHVEIDPVEEAPANLWDKLDRIVGGVRAVPDLDHRPTVRRGDARALPYEEKFFDVIVTDPPYFDNVHYHVLADCVYVWKRLALRGIFDGCFEAECTDGVRELVMNRHVHGDLQAARDDYAQGLLQALSECRRVLKEDGVLSMIFAHSTVEGWATLVSALARAKLDLVAAWPMYVERQHRPRGMRSRAVNTSFVLVCRRRPRRPARRITWEDFRALLEEELEVADRIAPAEKFGPHTLGRTLFGRAVSRCTAQDEILRDGEPLALREVLALITEFIDETLGTDSWGVRRG